MKKRFLFLALLLAATLLVSACSSSKAPETNQQNEVQQASGQVSPMEQADASAAAAESTGSQLPEGYDPASEEDGILPVLQSASDRVYAGATPIPINPIDMPTATPRPDLTFTYGDYTAGNLGFTFRSAVGYDVSDSMSSMYVLTEPAAAVKDNYPCVISFEVSAINSNYGVNNIKTDLASYLENEGKQYNTWETWQAASRTLLGGKGFYNNYRGVLADGTVVRGRVHMAIISDSQLLTLHITCPGGYNTSYMKIYDQIRSTIKFLK